MATVHPSIDDALARWILQQHVFFVATAPLDAEGLINCSPKGLDSLAILDPHSVAYLDMTGSGAETIANVKENGRIVIMFCAFDGPAQIVRLHGQGHVIEPHHPGFRTPALAPARPARRPIDHPRQRQPRVGFLRLRRAKVRVSGTAAYAGQMGRR